MYGGRLVFIDFAHSFQLPPEGSRLNTKVRPGESHYQPHEVYREECWYNAYGYDLWAVMVILFEFWTGSVLYQIPDHADLYFRYFIMAGGISMDPWNKMTDEVWEDILEFDSMSEFLRQDPNPRPSRLSCVELQSIFLELSAEVRDIFAHVLRLLPEERWGLDDVFPQSRFMIPPT